MGFASQNIRTEWSRHDTHCEVQVSGTPALHEFFSFLSWLSIQTEGWSVRRLLLDLRGVRSMHDREDQRIAGDAVGLALRHVEKVAAIVPAHVDADQGGCDSVFTDERGALDWLLEN